MTDCVGFPRWTADATFSGGGWSASYPVSNLGRLPLSRVARSMTVQPAQTQWRGELTKPRLVQIVALCRHNLTLGARWRVRLYADSDDVAPVFDSGLIDVWSQVLGQDEATWDGGNWWDLKYTADYIQGWAWYAPLFIPGQVTAQAFTVELVDTANPAGFVEVGLCEVASALDFPISTAFGSQVGFQSRTTVIEADGGVEYFERRAKPRTFTGAIAAVARATALSRFFEMQRQHDVDVPFFWWPTRESKKDALRTAFLARMQQLDPITQAYAAHDQIAVNYKEVI